MISQTAEYALRAMVFLAEHPGRLTTAVDIAESTQVPAGYLSKIMQMLVRDGLVRSRRGLRGGFTLAEPPERMSVLRVIQAVDPISRIDRCPLGNEEHCDSLCPLHQAIDLAIEDFHRRFESTSVADLRGRQFRSTEN